MKKRSLSARRQSTDHKGLRQGTLTARIPISGNSKKVNRSEERARALFVTDTAIEEQTRVSAVMADPEAAPLAFHPGEGVANRPESSGSDEEARSTAMPNHIAHTFDNVSDGGAGVLREIEVRSRTTAVF